MENLEGLDTEQQKKKEWQGLTDMAFCVGHKSLQPFTLGSCYLVCTTDKLHAEKPACTVTEA